MLNSSLYEFANDQWRSLLLHAVQNLHPLKWSDVGIGALAEYREDVTFQGADDSLGGTPIPVGEA